MEERELLPRATFEQIVALADTMDIREAIATAALGDRVRAYLMGNGPQVD